MAGNPAPDKFSLSFSTEVNIDMKFANATPLNTATTAPTSIGTAIPTRTHQGGQGYLASDAHVELFNTAVSGLLEDKFYEKSSDTIRRLQALVPKCDPRWLQDFIGWLRVGANLRSASIVLAAEYVKAGFPNGRQVVASAIRRPDEMGEMLGYWHSRYGRKLPASLKRGIADATTSLVNENALLRYDGQNRAFRLGDIIEIVHPSPKADWQSDLFRFALDRRRHPEVVVPESLSKVRATLALDEVPKDLRTDEMFLSLLGETDADFSWERASTWLGRPLTKATWEGLVPTMGYTALIRNLRNFEQAGVDPSLVIPRLVDPELVSRSRILPYQLLQAYRNIDGDVYRVALQDAADLALQNLPQFEGHWLILVDRSGSMGYPVGEGRSSNPLNRSYVAAFYGEALARRCEGADLYSYDTVAEQVQWKHSIPLLRAASSNKYSPRGGTHTWTTVRQLVRPHHKGVIIITDEQAQDRDPGGSIIPVVSWNVAGYNRHQAAHGTKNRYLVSGFSDTALKTLPAVIAFGSTGRWPWETE